MTAVRYRPEAIQPYKHDLVITDLYSLMSSTEIGKGEAVEISTQPATLVGSGGGDQKIEVIRSRGDGHTDGEDYADMMIGISIEHVTTTRIHREFKVLTHGSVLAKNASSTNAIRAGCLFQSAANGGITEATAFGNIRGKTYVRIPLLRFGVVFVF